MTEQDWMNAADPQLMVDFLCRQHKISRRKNGRCQLRLFACACCRQLGDLLTDERSQQAIEVSERHADGKVDKKGLAEAQSAAEAAKTVLGAALTGTPARRAAWIASGAVVDVAGTWPAEVIVRLVLSQAGLAARAATGEGESVSASGLAALHELYRRQGALVHCIFGNPYRPPLLDSAWLRWNHGIVRKLAQAANEHRSLPDGMLDRNRLAVLADALEESGCNNEDLVGHLRGPGPHVRGCWPIDLLLGKI